MREVRNESSERRGKPRAESHAAGLAFAASGAVGVSPAYPLDGFDSTGIRRLE